MSSRDDALPAAAHLLGDARPLLDAALAMEGATVRTCQRRQVLHRPGRMLAVRYRVGIDDRAGRRRHQSIVAVADRHGPPEGSLVVEAGDDLSVGLFRFPHDPMLPGLQPLLDPDRAAELASLAGPVRVQVRTYRPLQRAVAHLVGADGSERYVKALPPAELADAVHRHQLRPHDLPGPHVVAAHDDLGLLVLDAVPGTSLRDQLRTGAMLPDPDQLVELLDRLGQVTAGVPVGRRPPIPAAAHHAVLLGEVVPSSRRRIARLLDWIGPDRPTSTRTVHGDLHPGQVLVRGDVISGLIDLDDVGTGAPVDDLASFLGHLACLATERDAPSARRFLASTLGAFEAITDPEELHRRTAATVLGLATGPHRVQRPGWEEATVRRVALAERWAAGDVRSLRLAS